MLARLIATLHGQALDQVFRSLGLDPIEQPGETIVTVSTSLPNMGNRLSKTKQDKTRGVKETTRGIISLIRSTLNAQYANFPPRWCINIAHITKTNVYNLVMNRTKKAHSTQSSAHHKTK